jgi:hypothetical protein
VGPKACLDAVKRKILRYSKLVFRREELRHKTPLSDRLSPKSADFISKIQSAFSVQMILNKII